MAFNRPLTIIEKNINFNLYERFLDTVKDQSIRELREIMNEQKNAYAITTKNILRAKDRVSKQINEIDILKIKYYQPFYNVIKEYLNVVCLFGLKQTTKELKIKNPKKLSMEMVSWINATSNTITNKYLNDTNLKVTLPIIDNIGRGLSDIELVYRINLLFDQIIIKQPAIIFNGIEGKALFRGRDLAMQIFNRDIKLEAEGFLAATTKEFFQRERVVAAQWSAILDSHTCPLCAQLDGHIVDIESPDYAFYNPGSMHGSCRCMWAYIRSSERPENRVIDWKAPSATLLKKYAHPVFKDRRKIVIEDDDGEE